jgi:hypothetical protein
MPFDTLEDAQHELQVSIAEAIADNPDVGADDVAHDMVVSVAWNCTDEVALELCRTEIGCVPSDLVARLGRKDWIQ